MPKTTDFSDLDQQINAITNKLKERVITLRQEVAAGQQELEHLSEQYERLTGKSLDANGSHRAQPGPKAGGATKAKAKGKGKRTRRPGVSVEWLQEHLAKKPMTVRQLQQKAEEEGLSGLRIPEILKGSKGKFKSELGERQPGVKGIPGAVWGVK
jgi:hypothetical protein